MGILFSPDLNPFPGPIEFALKRTYSDLRDLRLSELHGDI